MKPLATSSSYVENPPGHSVCSFASMALTPNVTDPLFPSSVSLLCMWLSGFATRSATHAKASDRAPRTQAVESSFVPSEPRTASLSQAEWGRTSSYERFDL